MRNLTRGTNAPRTKSPVSPFCWWKIPEKGFSVHLHLSTVEWLNNEITEALRSPERKEVGGLLLGRTELDRRRRIVIERFVPVACEHRLGPSNHVPEEDKQLLGEEIARWQPRPGKNLYAVGFYRFHDREGLGLDGQDIALAREYFSGVPSILLLIKPFPGQISMGGFFFSEEGEIQCDSRLLLPFSRNTLPDADTSVVPPQAATESAGEYQDYLKPEMRHPIRIGTQTILLGLKARLPLVLVLVILAVALAALGYRFGRNAAVPKTEIVAENVARLALKIDIEASQLRVSWDNKSPSIKSARGGTLSISDGNILKEFNLDSYLLRTGSIVYSHSSSEVTVQLHVLGEKSEARESVRVLGSDPSSGASWATADPVGRPSRSPGSALQKSQDPSGSVRAQVDPLSFVQAASAERAPGKSNTTVFPPNKTSAPARLPTQEGQETTTALSAQLDRMLPPEHPGDDTGYVGPSPLHRVDPNRYFELRPFIVESVQINMRVYVDSTGKVVRTESLSRGSMLMEHLSKIASDAVRQWTFAPARRGSKNVSSETVLQFQFLNRLRLKSRRDPNT